ncbi:MAG TPA: lysylphosphatidylglycerol synthase transmembrane domain-containing protein, partial [Chroococcales cyanobacterium]
MVSERTSSAAVLEPRPNPVQHPEVGDLTSHAKPQSGGFKQRLRQAAKLSPQTKTTAKILMSLLMIGSLFIFGKIDLSKSLEIATQANVYFLVTAVVFYLSTVVVNAYRWQILAAAVGLHKPLMKMVQFCFVGMFFNLFLPSTVGGDFTRCYYLSKGTGKYGSATYSVLADRVVGISVLFLFASLGILLGPGGGGIPWHLKGPIFASSLAVFFVLPMMPKLTSAILGESNWLT